MYSSGGGYNKLINNRGDFSITPTCSVVTGHQQHPPLPYEFDFYGTSQNAYKDVVCSVLGNKVTTSATLLYPTASVIFRVTLTNTGSIPAVIKSVDSPNNVDVETTNGEFLDSKSLILSNYILDDGDRENIFFGQDIIGSKLEPGESKDMLIVYSLETLEKLLEYGISVPSEQPEVPAEGVTTTYDVTLGFEQITAD